MRRTVLHNNFSIKLPLACIATLMGTENVSHLLVLDCCRHEYCCKVEIYANDKQVHQISRIPLSCDLRCFNFFSSNQLCCSSRTLWEGIAELLVQPINTTLWRICILLGTRRCTPTMETTLQATMETTLPATMEAWDCCFSPFDFLTH